MSLIYQGCKTFVKKVEICKINNLEVVLGQGGQATVYKAMLTLQQSDQTERQIDIALKRIILPKSNIARQRFSELIKREQSVYRSTKSPYIVKLYGTNLNFQKKKLEDLEYLDFYFELCDGCLADLIKDRVKGIDVPLNEENALEIFEAVFEVELLLEKSFFQRSTTTFQGLFHRDINIKNILYKKKKHKIEVKVCDFGVANYSQDLSNPNNQIEKTQKIGTLSFTSPENTLQQFYESQKNEAWSLGMLLFCLLKGLSNFKSVQHLFNNKNDHHNLIEKMQLQSYTKDLLINLLQMEPEKRWDYTDIKNSQWYTLFGQKKCKILERIQPCLKFRKKCFNELSLKLIKYQQFIDQNKQELLEFQIPQDLLLITIKSYELWSWKQLEKYSGSYCYEYQSQVEIEEQKASQDQIKRYEKKLIKITQDLREFFQQITQNQNLEQENQQNQKQLLESKQHENQENKNWKKKQEFTKEEQQQIKQYWSQIICHATTTSHYKPDALHYYMHLFEEMEQKLLSRLSIFSIQNNQHSINFNPKSLKKIPGQISELKSISKAFSSTLNEKQIKKSKLQEYLEKKQSKNDTKQPKDIEQEHLNQLKEEIDDLIFQVDECKTAIKQKEKILQILEKQTSFQKILQMLQEIQKKFYRYFYWKKEKEYLQIFPKDD